MAILHRRATIPCRRFAGPLALYGLALCLVILIVGAGYRLILEGVEHAETGLPITSPEEAVRKLLFDRSYGLLAVEPCVDYADGILPYLISETQNFACIYPMQVGRLAHVLSRIRTERCGDVLLSVLARKSDEVSHADESQDACKRFASMFAKSIAAYALVKQGKVDLARGEVAYLQEALRDPGPPETQSFTETSRGLCALSLAHIGTPEVVRTLLDALPGVTHGGDSPLEVVDALAIVGAPTAAKPLRALLNEGSVNAAGFPYDQAYEWASYYGDRVFRALILLEDVDSVGLLIEHVRPEMPRDYWVLYSLRALTGQDFGNDPRLWTAWWTNARTSFRLSADTFSKLKEEVESERNIELYGLLPWEDLRCFSSLAKP